MHRSSSRSKQRRTCIEDLPDDVLFIIMSKLSVNVKECFRASLISKRWLSLPTCLSEITFDGTIARGSGGYSGDLFIERANKFLEQYGKPGSRWMPLSVFRISFYLYKNCVTDINNWIGFALSNGVRVLDVVLRPGYVRRENLRWTMYDHYLYVFPCDLLNKTHIALERLLLVSCVFGRNLNTKLTSLKEVELWATHVTEADTLNIATYCTSLTKLTFDFCILPERLIVGGSSLTYLRVECCEDVREIELSDGRALMCFSYQGMSVKFIKFCEAPQLTHVRFGMCDCDDFFMDDLYVPKVLLRDFPAMKSLVLSRFCDTLHSPSFEPGAFCKLEVLHLVYEGSSTFSLLSVLKLLRACPVVRSFEMVPPFRCEVGKDENVRLPIQAFHNSLKTVEIREFTCSKEEVKLVSMIIQASAALDQVTIICLRKGHKEFQGIQKMKLAKTIFLKMMQGRTLIFS
uniref:At1g61320/AtMIF1 LRR domain-containing protein n=1 Tax=Kalanchoe fedtschenkoi TaxID=63787 RepID=A0A7N1A238_KALFE